MTIDKEQLISLLKKKTELDRDEVESQLTELIHRIQQAAEEGKTFEVEGFGVFGMQEDTLHFEPSDRLETEINNKYAGMKPIELIGAFKEPEADEEVPEITDPDDAETEEKWAFDSEAKEKDNELSEQDHNLAQEAPDQPEEVGAPELEIGEETADEVFDAVFGAGDEPEVQIVEEDEEAGSASPKEIEEEKSGDIIGTVLVALVVIISLGISGYVIYDLSSSDLDSRQNATSSSEQAEAPTPSTEDEPESIDEGSAEPEASETEGVEDRSEPEDAEQVPTGEGTQGNAGEERYGLHGTLNESINGGYTIVVHSLGDRDKARENQQRLQEAGFRALINQARIQGTTYYRVGLGQFETVEDAQEAIPEIPREYSNNHFIKRIQ